MRSILTGRTPPTETDPTTGAVTIISEFKWSNVDDMVSSYNNKALHALFNCVGEGYIKLISSCVSAKEARDILQRQFERTPDVKHYRSIMLQTKFENIRMSETESLTDFYERLSDITNEFFA